jgi:hypothetical protein
MIPLGVARRLASHPASTVTANPISMTQLRRSSLLAALVAAALPAAGRAQQPAAPAPKLLPQQSVAVNPLAIPFGVFSAEYEAALPTAGFTIGVGGTHFASGGDRDSWAELKGLYYPNETPFHGFSVGLSAGVHSSRRNTTDCSFIGACTNTPKTQTAPTLGVLVSYDWLLGRAQKFRVGLGAGAKRVLKDVGSNDPLEQVYPDGRFVIGLVF